MTKSKIASINLSEKKDSAKNHFKSNIENVVSGALVKFIRNGKTFMGVIQDIRQTTATVAIYSHSSIGKVDGNNITVVNHANYDIITNTPEKYITDLNEFVS